MSTRRSGQQSTTTSHRKEPSSLKRRRLQDDSEEFFDAVQSFKSQARSVTCTICYDDLPSTQFPHITHEHSGGKDKNSSIACLSCWENHLHSELERKDWDKLSCLDCGKVMELSEIQTLDSLFTKKIEPLIMEKAAKAYLKTDADWVDCPSSSCKSGSLMVDGHIFTCQECKYRYCFSCKVLMHEGETCTAYKKRMKRDKKHVKDEELSKKKVEKISKPCPKCGIRINKYTGCDHVTCQKCKHEFCWVCFASYLGSRGIHRRGNAAHKSSCRYHSGRLPEYEPDDEGVVEADVEADAEEIVDEHFGGLVQR